MLPASEVQYAMLGLKKREGYSITSVIHVRRRNAAMMDGWVGGVQGGEVPVKIQSMTRSNRICHHMS